jgi:hypothetical protein
MTTPTPTPTPTPPVDVRANIVAWAKWGMHFHERFTYTEGRMRMSDLGIYPPNAATGNYYGRVGYTGTLLSHGTHIPANLAQPGDLVVYGPGTGAHTAVIINVGQGDILTISHGGQGDPNFAWVTAPVHTPRGGIAVDGRPPQTFLRFNTTAVNTAHVPPAF